MSMHADALALEMRRHAENAADGDDAGAADAGDDDVVGLRRSRGSFGSGSAGEIARGAWPQRRA